MRKKNFLAICAVTALGSCYASNSPPQASVVPYECTSNICNDGKSISAEESHFFQIFFPSLKGKVTEFYADEDYGFQESHYDYRFTIDTAGINELVKKGKFELSSEANCTISDSGRSWWKARSANNKRCYFKIKTPRGDFYKLLYDVDRQVAYLTIHRK
jgi:hypothetical protein